MNTDILSHLSGRDLSIALLIQSILYKASGCPEVPNQRCVELNLLSAERLSRLIAIKILNNGES